MKKGITKENEKLLKDIGLKIRKLRDRKNMSQEELAFTAQLDRTYITGIENGKRNISVTTFCKLAEALDIKINLINLLNGK